MRPNPPPRHLLQLKARNYVAACMISILRIMRFEKPMSVVGNGTRIQVV